MGRHSHPTVPIATFHETMPIERIVEEVPRDAGEYVDGLGGEMVTPAFSAGWDSQDKIPGYNQDSVYAYYDEETANGIFAVFDGMGGEADGDKASAAARQSLHDAVLKDAGTRHPVHEGFAGRRLHNIMRDADEAVKYEAPGGGTTALVAFLHHYEGQSWLDVAAVGDSLGYIVHVDGKVEPLNREETVERAYKDRNKPVPKDIRHPGTMITNALGAYQGLHEQQRVRVYQGDYVVLTTDGITGDNDRQRMRGGDNESMIGWLVRDVNMTPREKAEELIYYATKHDDRTAMVIQVGMPVAGTEMDYRGRHHTTSIAAHAGSAALHN